MSNIDTIRNAYAAWAGDKGLGNSINVLRAMMADQVAVTSVLPGAPCGAAQSCDQTMGYFAAILKDWEMVEFKPETVLEQGDHVAMFGTCAWRHKGTGKTAECMISNLWRFKDGKVVEFIDLFDSAAAIEAATP